MKIVIYILISCLFFTSCKSSFTKRHYRSGIFREYINNVKNTTASNKKQNQQNQITLTAKVNTGKPTITEFIATKKTENYNNKKSKAFSSIKPKTTVLESTKVSIKTKSIRKKNMVSLKKGSINLNGFPLLLILYSIILLGIFLLFLISNFSEIVWIVLIVFLSIGALIGLTYLIMLLINSFKEEHTIKTNEIKTVGDKDLWRLKDSLSKLSYLNWISIVSIFIGAVFVFLFSRTAVFFSIVGFIFLLITLVRFLQMIRAYKKCKSELSNEELHKYRKTKKTTFLLLLVLILSILVWALFLF